MRYEDDVNWQKSAALSPEEDEELWELCGRGLKAELSEKDKTRMMELIETDVRACAAERLTAVERSELFTLRARLQEGLEDHEVDRYAELMLKACPIEEGGRDFLSRRMDRMLNGHQRFLVALIVFLSLVALYLYLS